MENTAIGILQAARALIASPENWAQGGFHHHPKGGERAYCALGAVNAAAQNVAAQNVLGLTLEGDIEEDADIPNFEGLGIVAVVSLHEAVPLGYRGVAPFNDDECTTHADVLALYDRAIDLASVHI